MAEKIAIQDVVRGAIEKYPDEIMVVPMRAIVLDYARDNDKRGAYVKLAVPDEMVKSLKGPSRKAQSIQAVVDIPREVLERLTSRLVTL